MRQKQAPLVASAAGGVFCLFLDWKPDGLGLRSLLAVMTNEITTVGHLRDLLSANRQSENALVFDHAKSLVEARKRGSTTKEGFLCALVENEREVEDVTEKFGNVISAGCKCYQFHAPEMGGKLLAISLEQAWSEDWEVSIRLGSHGPELFVDRPLSDDLGVACETISVIVGNYCGEDAIFTWHPGDPLGTITNWGTVGVKLHHGAPF